MNFLADTPRLEIFRLAGIPIKVDITFALVPIFLFGVFQQSPVAFAVLVAGVFLSVLLHEFGHAIVARLFRRSGRRDPGRRVLRLRANAPSAPVEARQHHHPVCRPSDQRPDLSSVLECARPTRASASPAASARSIPHHGSKQSLEAARGADARRASTSRCSSSICCRPSRSTAAGSIATCWARFCLSRMPPRNDRAPRRRRRIMERLHRLPHQSRAAFDRRPDRDHQLVDPEAPQDAENN